MNWAKGYTSSIYIKTVDANSWRDIDRIDLYGGKISRTNSGLMETASVDCVNYDQSAERWVRVWMDTRQEGAAAHVALFTGLATSPGRDINGIFFTNTVECYSVLKPAADVLLPRGWYAAAGADGAALVETLLSVTPAPKVVSDNSPILTNSYVAENGETNLTMAWKILDAINWRLRIEGNGTINIMPKASAPEVTFDCIEYDAIEPELTVDYDWFSCPNVFRAVRSGVSAVATDDDPDSIFSTASRGREIWAEEQSVKLNDGESLEEYAARRLKELQNVVYSAKYDRRYHPDVLIGDLVQLHYPAQGIDGVFRVTAQSIDLDAAAKTSEEGEMYET